MEENGEQNLKDNKETESYQSIKQSTQEMEVPRVFILGAGFSAPAGLPLAQNLLDIIRAKANQQGASYVAKVPYRLLCGNNINHVIQQNNKSIDEE